MCCRDCHAPPAKLGSSRCSTKYNSLGSWQTGVRPNPDWILYVPESYLTPEARRLAEELIARGDYATRIVSGTSALFEHAPRGPTYAHR